MIQPLTTGERILVNLVFAHMLNNALAFSIARLVGEDPDASSWSFLGFAVLVALVGLCAWGLALRHPRKTAPVLPSEPPTPEP